MASHNIGEKRTDLFHFSPNELVIIGHDTPHKSVVEHPNFDPRSTLPVDESFVDNVLAYGIIQPIRCITVGKGETLQRLVVAGRQRVKAARIANERLEKEGSALRITVPVMFEKGADEARVFGVRISENEIRRNDSTLIKAANAVDMATRFGKNRAEIAVAFGKTRQTIDSWFKLNALHQAIKDAIRAGKLSVAKALPFADVPLEEQPKKLEELLLGSPVEETSEEGEEEVNESGVEAPKASAPKSAKEVKARLAGKGEKAPTIGELNKLLKAFDAGEACGLDENEAHLVGMITGQRPLKGAFGTAIKKLRK